MRIINGQRVRNNRTVEVPDNFQMDSYMEEVKLPSSVNYKTEFKKETDEILSVDNKKNKKPKVNNKWQ